LGAKNIDPAAAQDAMADLQNQPFSGARQAVEVARFILAGDAASVDGDGLLDDASQATSAPSSETVQNPAAE
jgi:hypothetical protein